MGKLEIQTKIPEIQTKKNKNKKNPEIQTKKSFFLDCRPKIWKI
jgi:hypothetical protein